MREKGKKHQGSECKDILRLNMVSSGAVRIQRVYIGVCIWLWGWGFVCVHMYSACGCVYVCAGAGSKD